MAADLWGQANALFSSGDYHQSRRTLLKWMWLHRKNETSKAWGIDLLIRLRMARGFFKDAKTLYWCRLFQQKAGRLANLELLARKNHRQAFFHFYDGELVKAQKLYQLAVQQLIASGQSNSYVLSDYYVNLGICERYLENYPAAISYFERARQIARDQKLYHTLRKIYRELTYCYFFQDKYRPAYETYSLTKKYTERKVHNVELMILEAYLLVLRKKWKAARQKLLMAYLEKRKMKLSRQKFELHFHMAFLLVLRGKHKKAWRFMSSEPDITYQMVLLREELKKKGLSTSHVMKKYLSLAEKIGLKRHLLQKKDSPDVRFFYFDFHKKEVHLGTKKVTLPRQERLSALLIKYLFDYPDGLTKEQIIFKVFDYNHYHSEIHDTKVYTLVWKTNRLLGDHKIIHSQTSKYQLNLKYTYLKEGEGSLCAIGASSFI